MQKKSSGDVEVRLGYIAVSAERGQLSWNLEGLQPGSNIKRRKHTKKGTEKKFWWKTKLRVKLEGALREEGNQASLARNV